MNKKTWMKNLFSVEFFLAAGFLVFHTENYRWVKLLFCIMYWAQSALVNDEQVYFSHAGCVRCPRAEWVFPAALGRYQPAFQEQAAGAEGRKAPQHALTVNASLCAL